jgi:hypothetical protein
MPDKNISNLGAMKKNSILTIRIFLVFQASLETASFNIGRSKRASLLESQPLYAAYLSHFPLATHIVILPIVVNG